MRRCNDISGSRRWVRVCPFGASIVTALLGGSPSFGAEQSLQPEPAVTAEIYADSFSYQGHSPDLRFGKVEEGIASDGTNRFLIYRRSIVKVDSTWTNIIISNDAPFAGLTGYDHLGAGECYQGKLYIAAEAYHGCDHVTNQSICVFDANTLKRVSTTSVSNYTSEVSAVTVVTNAGPRGVMFVSNFCDESKLYRFELADLSFAGVLPLDQPVSKLQGLACHNGMIYAVTDSGTNAVVFDIDPTSGHTRKLALLTFPHGKEAEGCLFDKDRLEVLVASHTNRFNYVYYFSP